MRLNKLFHLVLFSIVYYIIACSSNKGEQKPEVNPLAYKKNLENANRTLSQNEELTIEDYIKRYQYPMIKTSTGLRYWIYEKGKGKLVTKNSIVRFEYKLKLINDVLVYDSKKDGIKEVHISRYDEPPGLIEALQYMREGDKAKIIVPSHLGYGLLGDQNLIPPKAVLIYDINILKVI